MTVPAAKSAAPAKDIIWAALAPDGRLLAASCEDGAARVWSLDDEV